MHGEERQRSFCALLRLPQSFCFLHAAAGARRQFRYYVHRLGRRGLCSYLLIGYWFKNVDYTKAAKKAFVMNRIGDLGFLLSGILDHCKAGHWNYADVFANVSKLSAG
jgi:NADH:ubiquinone oxidoreductase subunit 5 (subunit L)/multisubunit Na+/H+ antiporter MnhA subunit